jgi:DNA-binding NtrC family response regulator
MYVQETARDERSGTRVAQAAVLGERCSMRTVLVAEDEHLTRWSVAQSLREENYEVHEASNGQSAIDLINAKTFDAVITDYHMAGTLNGLDVLKHYERKSPGKTKVLITDEVGAQQEVDAIGGILVPKPFLLEDLVGIVNRRTDVRTPLAQNAGVQPDSAEVQKKHRATAARST